MIEILGWIFAERKRLLALEVVLAFVEASALWLSGARGEYFLSHSWPFLFFLSFIRPISLKWETSSKNEKLIKVLGLVLLLIIPIDFAATKAGLVMVEIFLTAIIVVLALIQIVIHGPSFVKTIKGLISLSFGLGVDKHESPKG